jgi:hypothetical protein
MSVRTIAYLETLVKQGTHGTSVPGVARTLIEEGVRSSIERGLLPIEREARS